MREDVIRVWDSETGKTSKSIFFISQSSVYKKGSTRGTSTQGKQRARNKQQTRKKKGKRNKKHTQLLGTWEKREADSLHFVTSSLISNEHFVFNSLLSISIFSIVWHDLIFNYPVFLMSMNVLWILTGFGIPECCLLRGHLWQNSMKLQCHLILIIYEYAHCAFVKLEFILFIFILFCESLVVEEFGSTLFGLCLLTTWMCALILGGRLKTYPMLDPILLWFKLISLKLLTLLLQFCM